MKSMNVGEKYIENNQNIYVIIANYHAKLLIIAQCFKLYTSGRSMYTSIDKMHIIILIIT